MDVMYDYYQIINQHYSSQNDRKGMLDDIHNTMTELEDNAITEYDGKIGNPFFTRTGLLNKGFPNERSLDVVCSFKRAKDDRLSAETRMILFNDNQVRQGDYMYLPDNWNGYIDKTTKNVMYMVFSLPDNHRNYFKSVVMKCNTTIKLLDEDGIPREYHLQHFDNKTRMRVNVNDSGIIPNSNSEAYIRKDEITGRLGKEFSRVMIWDEYMNKYVYLEVVSTNPNDNEGMISLLFKDSSYIQSEDSLELGIADYQKQLALTKPTQPTGTIQGKDELFLTEVGDYELVGIVNPSTEWSISSPNAQLIVIDDTRCQVKCLSANNETITLTAKLGTATFTKEIMLARW